MGDGGAAVLVVPAYNPTVGLPELIRRILAAPPTPFAGAVIVDDGSVVTAQPAFAAVEAIPGVVVLRRPANGGKGAALKDGYRAAFERWPDAIGVVTADADGQHDPGDVTQVARTLIEHPDHLVLGVRRLDGSVPWRSRVGNHTARALVQLVAGGRFTDTQTGLRGWPRSVACRSLQLTTSGYDFELDALLAFRAVPRIEVPIATIYLEGNRHSHFRPVRDSLWIARVLWRHWRNRSGGGAVPSPD